MKSSGIDRRRKGECGSAVVELAICLPVYVALVLGILLLGDATLVKQEIAQAGAVYSLRPGNQTTTDLTDVFFAPFEGTVVSFDDREDFGDIYSNELLEDAMERIGTGEFFVHYVITPLGLDTKVTGGERTWQGRYIDEHDLENSSNLSLISDVLNGWLSQNETTIEYNYKPYFLEALFGDLADALREKGESAASVERLMETGVTIEGTSITAGRGERVRTVAASGGYNKPIEEELLSVVDPDHVPFPDYPNFSVSATDHWGAN
jgi:hypothetical protein